MGWVREFVRFPERTKCFLLPRSRALNDALRMLESSPDATEAALRGIIKEHRPELEHCSISAMSMNYEAGCWEVHVEHPSFPQRVFGSTIARELLIKDDRPVLDTKN